MSQTRRDFLRTGAVAVGAGLLGPGLGCADEGPLFKISLAEWSLHNALFGRKGEKLDNLDFARYSKEQCGIDAIEYVNQFFFDKAGDENYLKELNKRASDLGVRQLLIMIDREGNLGDPDDNARVKAVQNHHKWVDAAKYLGCHSIRVNAGSSGSYEEQKKLAIDGLSRLTEYGVSQGINVIVENHGGLSSNGKWLKEVMEQVGRPNVGTLPDFGNFGDYDRYQGVKELMPYAKGVSAKSHEFDEEGNEKRTDYLKMMKIVLAANFHGYVGIEWEGEKPDEMEGIRLTKKLLERVRDQLTKEKEAAA